MEFPAVLLNVLTGQIESEFHQFVRPTNDPVLSSYCRELTGITQQQVDRAKPFPEVFQSFKQWLEGIIGQKHLIFYTKENLGRNIGQNATFASWSNWDLGECFEMEMKRHQMVRPICMAVWVDFQDEYGVCKDKTFCI